MTLTGRLLLAGLTMILYSSVFSMPCSFEVQQNCTCTSVISLISINCSNSRLTNQTTPLITSVLHQPVTIQQLIITHSRLSALTNEFFRSVGNILTLDLSHNSFTTFPPQLNVLKNITILNLSHNKIRTLDLGGLDETGPLRVLDVSHNLIDKIVINDSKVLQFHIMKMSHNNITSVPDAILTSAESLSLGYNQISILPQLPESKIKYLTLSGNHLEKIPNNTFSKLHFLDELYLDNNRIQSITAASFYGAWALTELDLSDNFIDVLQDGQFQTLPNLITLKLARNNVQNLQQASFRGIRTNLQRLILNENNLSNISQNVFKKLENLRYLDLSNNPSLGDVNMIHFPSHLASLDLSNCSIQKVNDCKFVLYMDLQFLGLSNNNLTCSCHLSWLYRWQKYSRLNRYFSSDRELPNWKCFDSGNNLIDVSSNLTGCANSTEHRKHCEKQEEIYINPDLITFDLTVSTSSEEITAIWSMRSEYQIHGIMITYKTKDNTNFESPLLPSTATSYVIKDMKVKGSYTVCIHALFNETFTIKKECKVEDTDFVQMIVGILAGVIFIIPCISALVYILYKDYKVMNSLEYRFLDDVENSSVITQDCGTNVKVTGEVKLSETAKVVGILADSRQISSPSVKIETVACKASEKVADIAGPSHSNEAFESDWEQVDSDNCENTGDKENDNGNFQTKL